MISYFIVSIFALGIITSYEDLRYGKIRNIWIILALLISLLINGALIIYNSSRGTLNSGYVLELMTNFLFALIFGFTLWHYQVWTSADGKLFIAFSSLVPLDIYVTDYLKFTPSATLLINTFLIGFIVMLLSLITRLKKDEMSTLLTFVLRESFRPKELAISSVHMIALFWIIEIIFSVFGMQNNYVLRLAALFIMMNYLRKISVRNSLIISAAMILLRFIVEGNFIYSGFFYRFVILLVLWRLSFSFIRSYVSGLGNRLFSKRKKVSELKPGDVLSDYISIVDKDYKSKEIHFESLFKKGEKRYLRRPKSGIDPRNILEEAPEGLTKEDIKKLKATGVKEMNVVQTIPFAPFLFSGVIITILAKGNLLISLKILIGG